MSKRQGFFTLTADAAVEGGHPYPLGENSRPHVDANADGPLIEALNAVFANLGRKR
jgi:hypothetical protein